MKNHWLIPSAIVFVGIILAFAVFKLHENTNVTSVGDVSALAPIDSSDHILGNPAAPVVIIEYADMDSGYSKDFQKTLEQVIKDYADDGTVAWVYRHFPLVGQDPYSEQHAEAAECAATQGTNTTNTFFAFIDALQAATPGDGQFNPQDYPALISSLNLSYDTFNSCLQAHTYQKKIAAQYQNAMAIGATGSPYSVILVRGQKPVVVAGAVPYAALKKIMDKSISAALQSK